MIPEDIKTKIKANRIAIIGLMFLDGDEYLIQAQELVEENEQLKKELEAMEQKDIEAEIAKLEEE